MDFTWDKVKVRFIEEISVAILWFEDYGNEEFLWGKESSPQWCESPRINVSLDDRVLLRSSFIDANSKGQYATETTAEVRCGPQRRLKLEEGVIHPLESVYLRCTMNSAGTGGVWLLAGGGSTLLQSSRPVCVYGEPTFHLCELPRLIHRGLRVITTKKSYFFQNNDTIIISKNFSHARRQVLVRQSICTTQQVPQFLIYKRIDSDCNEKSTVCNFLNESLPSGTKILYKISTSTSKVTITTMRINDTSAKSVVIMLVLMLICFFLLMELRCRDNSTRLVGPSSVVCLNSEFQPGSTWYPAKWPSCIPKSICPEPSIQKGTYVSSDVLNTTFRHGTRIRFECNNNFMIRGSEVIECLKSGLWNDSFPECFAVGPYCFSSYLEFFLFYTNFTS
ncbi:unnamed protein product [Thelazia callipaeda]|uniref:Sushi domain-containing protein n=1 Tax=Thelazia callipaeda TaxID=103827 RepID=A0A0N5CP01_THECL|nr:unnamed protein product [Thelazia callipaeda]